MSLLTKATGRFARSTFGFWEKLGLHVTPVHFYEPIPDTRALPVSLWRPREAAGIEMNEAGQLAFLASCLEYKSEYENFPRTKPAGLGFWTGNPAFGSVDAEILYCMVRHFRPARVIEIGSGYSTFITAAALKENGTGQLTCIEPYPDVERLDASGVTLLQRRVQDVPIETFAALERNDILFIDSSHVICCGSDVQFQFFEIVPRLKPGVIIHFHDIFLPDEYPRHWILKDHHFWNEQYIVQAFLMYNGSFEVMWGAHFMHSRHAHEVAASFDTYTPNCDPGSFWIRRL